MMPITGLSLVLSSNSDQVTLTEAPHLAQESLLCSDMLFPHLDLLAQSTCWTSMRIGHATTGFKVGKT